MIFNIKYCVIYELVNRIQNINKSQRMKGGLVI